MVDRTFQRLTAHAQAASELPVAAAVSPQVVAVAGAFTPKGPQPDPVADAQLVGGTAMAARLKGVAFGEAEALGAATWSPITAAGAPVYGAGMLSLSTAARGATLVRPAGSLPTRLPRKLSKDAAIELVRVTRVLPDDLEKPEAPDPELVWFDPALTLGEPGTAQWAWVFHFTGDRPADVVVSGDGTTVIAVISVDPDPDNPYTKVTTPRFVLDDVTGVPRFVRFSPALLLPSASTGDAASLVREFFRRFPGMFGTADSPNQVVVQRVERDLDGGQHVHVDQRHGGLSVWGCRLAVHLDRSLAIVSVSGRWFREPEVDLVPTVTEQTALAAALKLRIKGTKGDKGDGDKGQAGAVTSGGLVILPWRLADPAAENHLAWWFSLPDEHRFVSAHTGRVVARIGRHQSVRKVFDANQARGGGTLDLEDGIQRSRTIDPESLGADTAIAATEAFWRVFARNGWGNHGDDSVVRVDVNLDDPTTRPVEMNGFWEEGPNDILLSRGFAEGDVVAHELTHGLTQATAGLVYAGESGALNESFSDVLGKVVVPAPRPWVIGFAAFGGRDLENPGIGRYRDYAAGAITPDTDHGGVHSNSGITNHAAVLVADGDRAHPGLGRERMARIWWDALTTRLTPWSTMADLAVNAWQVTTELIAAGRSGISLPGAPTAPPAFGTLDAQQVLWAFAEVDLPVQLLSGWFHVPGAASTNHVFRQGVMLDGSHRVDAVTLRVGSWRQQSGATAFVGRVDLPSGLATGTFQSGTVTATITQHGIGTQDAEVHARTTTTNMTELAVESDLVVGAVPGQPPAPSPAMPYLTPRIAHWFDNPLFLGRRYGDIVYENASLPAGLTVTDVQLQLLEANNTVIATQRMGEPAAANAGRGAYIVARTLGGTGLEVRVRSWHDFGWAVRYRLVYWVQSSTAAPLPALPGFAFREVPPNTL